MKTGLLLFALVLLIWFDGVSGREKNGEKKKSGWKKAIEKLSKKAWNKSKEAILKALLKSKDPKIIKILEKFTKANSSKEDVLAVLRDALKKKGKGKTPKASAPDKSDTEEEAATLVEALNTDENETSE